MPARSLALLDAREPRSAEIWRELEARAHASYFLAWPWVERWLAALPEPVRPQLAVIRDGGAPIAACFVARRRERRRVVMTSTVVHVNATGLARHDELCIEHNGLLAAPGAGASFGDLLARLPGSWDELAIGAADRDAVRDLAALPGYRVRVDHASRAPYVELAAVRAAGGDYAAVLGASTRAQLRKARRKLGRLEVEIACDAASATSIYDELIAIHSRRWQACGEPGAFADPWFARFHRELIAARLPHGEIQLVRVRAGGRTLGCLYNLVWRGRVLFYQCGLASGGDPAVRPGYVCHAAAIEHSAREGHAVYDLLGGGEYKERLATGAAELVWLRVQRPRLRFTLENYMVEAKRRSSARIASALGARNLLPWPGST
ncbi:MAG: GNAT family N-acetyltransferase [Acidobacteriota bacterium]